MSSKYNIWTQIIALAVGLTLWQGLGMVWYEACATAITCFSLLHFVTHLGKRILILELIIVLALLQWLFSAVITYEVFNRHNNLASLWVTFMTVTPEVYFSFALPGTLLLILGLIFPVNWKPIPSHQALVAQTQNYLKDRSSIGIWMSAIGVSVFFLVPYTPFVIRAILAFFSQLLYVGLFYVLLSPTTKYKNIQLVFVLSITLINSVMTGMYGEILFWGALYIIMYFMQYPTSLVKKILVFSFGLLAILLIQSIKQEYREATWSSGYVRSSDFGLFGSLIADRISNPSHLVDDEALFNISMRANQGLLIANTLNYVPKYEPFAHGETILTSVAAAAVPRLLWPNKPEAGGKANVQRFLGAEDTEISFNISPLGEGYVNFGKVGGVIFMFFYGLFFNWAFRYCLFLSSKYPSIIAWLPLLFVGTLGVETDLLTTLGSLIKAAMFTWFMFWFCRVFLRTKI